MANSSKTSLTIRNSRGAGKESKVYTEFAQQFIQFQSSGGNYTINPKQLRQLARNNPFVALAKERVKQKVTKTDWTIKARKETEQKKYQQLCDEVVALLQIPNRNSPDGSWRSMIGKILDDVLTFDYGVMEKVKNLKGDILELYHVDGATIFPQFEMTGLYKDGDQAFLQYIEPSANFPVVVAYDTADAHFTVDDLLVFIASPSPEITRHGRGVSPVEWVVLSVVAGINATLYNTSYFDETKVPAAMINLKGVDNTGLTNFKNQFLSQLDKNHALAFTNAEDMVFNLLRPNAKDMQFYELNLWLARIVISAFGLTPEEFGLTMNSNKATSQSQHKLSQVAGIETYLDVIAEEVNRGIIGDLARSKSPDYANIEFAWDVVDKGDPLTQAQVDQIYVNIGKTTPNELRTRDGEEPLTSEQKDEIAASKPQSTFNQPVAKSKWRSEFYQ